MENPPDRATALDFSGRAVIVTGGTRGLGRTIAGAFLDAGADVVTCARNAPEEPVASADGTRQAVFGPPDGRGPPERPGSAGSGAPAGAPRDKKLGGKSNTGPSPPRKNNG